MDRMGQARTGKRPEPGTRPAREADTRPSFEPIGRASTGRRVMLLTLGPLLWVIGIVAVSYVAGQTHAIVAALAILGVAMLIGLLVLIPLRWMRVREERER